MTDQLARLRELANAAVKPTATNYYSAMPDFLAALSPDVVLRLIACIEAADRMRRAGAENRAERDMVYDAHRAALDEVMR